MAGDQNHLRKNIMSQTKQTIISKTTQKPGAKQSRRRRKQKRKQRALATVSGGPGRALSMETLRIRRKELWVDHAVAAGDSLFQLDFDTTTGPAWFNKISEMYEMYQIHQIKIHVRPTAATTNSGGWCAAYNTNYDEKNATRTAAQIASQYGSAKNAIRNGGTVIIPGSAISKFRTNIPCRSEHNGWAFNLEVVFTSIAQACSVMFEIEYDVTLRNPQV